jgi:hypothetical protein
MVVDVDIHHRHEMQHLPCTLVDLRLVVHLLNLINFDLLQIINKES